MISLLIDTTVSHVTVAILKDDEILYKHLENITTDTASKIMPIIDECLKKSNISLNNIDKIFIANGPGSFTGIRVGVTISKTIAWALKKEIIPISSLELMATTNTNKKFLVPMIDARRGNVFAGIYDTELNVIKEESLISLNDLMSELNDDYELISYDNLNTSIVPNINIEKIIKKHKDDNGVNPHKLNPKYLKLTEAEENKIKND